MEMKEGEYGLCALYTNMKQNNETFCNCFRWGAVGEEGLLRWVQA
jgi:hypothetical protein